MRILMLSEFYPPLIGGTERHVQTLSRELVRRGHQVAVATLQTGNSPDFEDDDGVHIHRLTGWSRTLTRFYQNQSRQYHPPIPDPGVMAGLRRVISLERPEIVHARRWMLYSFVGLKSWSRARLVVTLHDYNLCCPTTGYLHNGQVCTGPAYRKCLRCAGQGYGTVKGALVTSGLKLSSHLHSSVDKYIAVSAAVRDASMYATGRPPKPIEVVPTFIPDTVVDEALSIGRPDFLPPTDNYILFVGRQDSHKGLDVLLNAYTDLSPTVPLVLLIAGSDDSSKQFPAGVTVIHNAPHAQVMAAWMHCAIGVVPSIWPEPFGQVAVEAMMCGKPVIASAIGGLRDVVVDGESGLLVEPGNANALKDAIRDLLLHPDKREQMGLVGKKRAHLFTVGTVANRIEEIYADLLTTRLP
ncbi:LPS biosynthesis RfbU related protein [Reticulibacter mediterranei]|uniref:LPS biosynthesis RfbU related protein n=1 Tax=Reticulibacter mediterranei TaxID=2778369 RepID=A0A8J3IL28_9CHLR|nr:glycosyltransferase family 4 protein [Reticulibacter mediterranei]GHO92161.1 LPS biosynthesis RfbU related protein [Reticulibacter mediterranei]